MTQPLPSSVKLIGRVGLIAGVIGLALCVFGWSREPRIEFFQAYLVGFIWWLGITLGCMAILMLQHLTGGAWGLVSRRVLEAGSRMVPVMLLLAIPLIYGVRDLYEWSRPGEADTLIQYKRPYLNETGFLVRGGIYFIIWMAMSAVLNRSSMQEDATGDARLSRRMQRLSGPGLVTWGLTISLAAVDWVMSLDVHWYSTAYGMLFMAGQALGALALTIFFLSLLSRQPPLSDVIRRGHFHDLGNLLLAMVMVWAYISFAQYLVIWSGNLPEENPYYVNRTTGTWRYVALFLVVCHFFIPFLLLLWRRVTTSLKILATVAVVIVAMRLVDLIWVIVPSIPGHRPNITLHWLNIAAPIGIGGLWLAIFVWQLGRRPLLPEHDPRLAEEEAVHA